MFMANVVLLWLPTFALSGHTFRKGKVPARPQATFRFAEEATSLYRCARRQAGSARFARICASPSLVTRSHFPAPVPSSPLVLSFFRGDLTGLLRITGGGAPVVCNAVGNLAAAAMSFLWPPAWANGLSESLLGAEVASGDALGLSADRGHSLLTVLDGGRLVGWDCKVGQLRTANLKSHDASVTPPLPTQLLQLEPPWAASDVTAVLPNATGTLLALVTPTEVRVVALPTKRGHRGTFDNGDPQISCDSWSIGGHTRSSGIVCARWHPYSLRHVVVLTADGALRLYDVGDPANEELSLSIGADALSLAPGFEGAGVPVSFDFGGPDSWDRFCIYVVCTSGSVYCFCPVIPRGRFVLLSASWVGWGWGGWGT